jgi:hypothetical protein
MKLHRFWLLLIAALLALLASTSAQPPAEGAMGREVPPIVGMTGEPFVATATPHLEDSYNFAAGLQTVELRFADGTAVTIVGSSVVPFMRALVASDRQPLDLSARPRTVVRLER